MEMNLTTWKWGSGISGLAALVLFVILTVLCLAEPEALENHPLFSLARVAFATLAVGSLVGWATVRIVQRLENYLDLHFLRMNNAHLDAEDTTTSGLVKMVPGGYGRRRPMVGR